MIRREHRTLALLLLAACGSLALLWYSQNRIADDTGHSATPMLSIARPVWRQYDERGYPVRELRARALEQRSVEQAPTLFEPRMQVSADNRPLWHLSARRATLTEQPQVLALHQAVRLRREPPDTPFVVTTDRLTVRDDGQLAETDLPVVIESGNWHVSATGLRADLGRHTVELLGKVKGRHE